MPDFGNVGRFIHGGIVIIAVIAYSVYLFNGLNNTLTHHFQSVLNSEMKKNPVIKKDYDKYMTEIKLERERQKQLVDFEEQAKKIQEQIQELTKSKQSAGTKAEAMSDLTKELSKILQQSKNVEEMEKKLGEFKGSYVVEDAPVVPRNEINTQQMKTKYVKFDNEL